MLWAVRCCSEGEQGEGEEPHTAAELVGGPQPLLFAATVNMGSRWPLAAWVLFLPTPVLGWAKLTFGSVHDSPRSKGIICGCWSVLKYLDFLSGRQKAPREREARFPVTMGSHIVRVLPWENTFQLHLELGRGLSATCLQRKTVQRPYCSICKFCPWDPKEDSAGMEGGGKEIF